MIALTYAAFSQYEDTIFRIQSEDKGTTVELLLNKVELTVQNEKQEGFSLFLQGPLEPQLLQGTYLFNHEELGELVMFMVPISKSNDVIRYQVVFNRLLSNPA